MLKLYTTPSCTSCRKAKKWLLDHDIEFVEHNIMREPMTERDLMQILQLTENGTSDIISTRSKVYARLDADLESLTVKELIHLLQENPSLLRRPLIVDERRLHIGYNEDEIRVFLPAEFRKKELASILLMTGL
ncbi:transcriptional regulator Spx [Enterococcus faecalis]